MEKQGVIAAGVTPPLESQADGDEKTSAAQAVENLDSDFRKKAADTVAAQPKK
jgi:hypothetical protein